MSFQLIRQFNKCIFYSNPFLTEVETIAKYFLQEISVTNQFTSIKYLIFFRYKNAKDSAEQMIVVPRYEPVFVEPNLKQYETQV